LFRTKIGFKLLEENKSGDKFKRTNY